MDFPEVTSETTPASAISDALADMFPGEPAPATTPAPATPKALAPDEGVEDPDQLATETVDEPSEAEAGASDDDEGTDDGKGNATDDEAGQPPASLTVPTLVADDLKAEFSVYDPEGKQVEGIPNVVIEYKANGKVRKDRLDQVVRLAQFGAYNHKREQDFVARQEQIEATANEVIERLEVRESQLRHLLENEDAYEQVRQRYMEENAPEKRAARAEREAREARVEAQRTVASAEGAQFYEQTILPVLDSILDAAPEVEAEELMAQFQSALRPIMKNGVVPKSMYGAVENYVETELREWATERNARRTTRATQDSAKAKAEAERAKVEAAKAKRAQASASAPVRTPAGGKAAAPRNPVTTTVHDAASSALDEVLSQYR